MTLADVVHEVFVRLGKRVTKNGLRIALKRRSVVRFIEATPIQACRLNIDNEEVQQFMENTEELLRNVPASFVFNMDETGINEYQNAKKKQVLSTTASWATRPSTPSLETRDTRPSLRASQRTEPPSRHSSLSRTEQSGRP